MTSKIKVDNINKVSDDSNIIKKCGSTTTVGSGSGQTIVDVVVRLILRQVQLSQVLEEQEQ